MISLGGDNGAVFGASRDNLLLWGEMVLKNNHLFLVNLFNSKI